MRRRGPNWRVGLDSTAGGRQPTVGAGRSSRERRYVGAASRPPERRRTVIRSTARLKRSLSRSLSRPSIASRNAFTRLCCLGWCAALSRPLVSQCVKCVINDERARTTGR